MWIIYILECNDGSFYTGITTNLEQRIIRHNSGKGSSYTKQRMPVVLKYWEEFANKQLAVKREVEIKLLSRANKQRLIRFGIGKRAPSA